MKWTAEQAYANWQIAFDEGLYTSARAWWAIYAELTFGGAR